MSDFWNNVDEESAPQKNEKEEKASHHSVAPSEAKSKKSTKQPKALSRVSDTEDEANKSTASVEGSQATNRTSRTKKKKSKNKKKSKSKSNSRSVSRSTSQQVVSETAVKSDINKEEIQIGTIRDQEEQPMEEEEREPEGWPDIDAIDGSFPHLAHKFRYPTYSYEYKRDVKFGINRKSNAFDLSRNLNSFFNVNNPTSTLVPENDERGPYERPTSGELYRGMVKGYKHIAPNSTFYPKY